MDTINWVVLGITSLISVIASYWWTRFVDWFVYRDKSQK